MSETRRLARSLVEPEPITMESRYPRAESLERVRDAARAFAVSVDGEAVSIAAANASFAGRWDGGAGDLRLVGELRPAARYRSRLAAISLTLLAVALLAAGAWIIEAPAVQRYSLTITFALAALFMPYLVIGMASAGDSDRARIRKALRVALQDEEERMPQARKWGDE